MKKLLVYSHWSAAKKWRIPYLAEFFADELAQCVQEGREHVIVFRQEDRFQKKGYLVHHCNVLSVRDSFDRLGVDYVVSIGLVFIQLIHSLNIQRGILLANLFCCAPDGRNALVTREELLDFALRAEGLRGRKKALRILQYTSNGCRSPMEALLFMVLNCPHLLGGFKLGPAEFDFEILVPPEYKHLTSKQFFCADIYYPSHKLIVEYYGGIHENTVEDDIVREKILKKMGYQVIVVDSDRFYNLRNFHEIIQILKRILGKRIRIRTTKFAEMFKQLRALLPRHESLDDKVEVEQYFRRLKEEIIFLRKVLTRSYYSSIDTLYYPLLKER